MNARSANVDQIRRYIYSRGAAKISMRELSRRCEIPLRTLVRVIAELRSRGEIVCERGCGRRANLYCVPASIADDRAIAGSSDKSFMISAQARICKSLLRHPRRTRDNRRGRARFVRPFGNTTPPHTPRIALRGVPNATSSASTYCVRHYPHRGCGQHWPGDPLWSPAARRRRPFTSHATPAKRRRENPYAPRRYDAPDNQLRLLRTLLERNLRT